MKYTCGTLALAAILALQVGTAAAQSTPVAAPLAAAAPAPTQMVEFLFTVFKGDNAMRQVVSNDTSLEPPLRELAEQAIRGFDAREMASQFAEPLSRIVSPQEYDQCLQFLRSEDAAAVRSVSATVTSVQELITAFGAMPVARQNALEAFFKLGCTEKTLAFMSSAEGKAISLNYGKHLMCAHIQRAKPEVLPKLQELGECQDL